MADYKLKFMQSTVLGGYRELALKLGLNPIALLRRLNIDRRALTDPDLLIPTRSFVELLEISAILANCPNFGLQFSMGHGAKVLGPLGILALNEPNVGQTLATISHNFHLYHEGLDAQFIIVDGVAQMSLIVDLVLLSSTRQIAEFSIGVGVNHMRMLLGNEWNPADIYFTHPAPADISLHQQVFKSPIHFKQDFSAWTFDEDDAKKTVLNADDLTRRYMLRYIKSIEELHGNDLVSITRRVIRDLLSSGRCDKTLTSRHMAIAPRTLQRKLSEQGYSFRQLIEEVRATLAVQLISNSHKPLSEVAEMVGFSELSAFSRFFQRIYGKSPSSFRSENSPDGRHRMQ